MCCCRIGTKYNEIFWAVIVADSHVMSGKRSLFSSPLIFHEAHYVAPKSLDSATCLRYVLNDVSNLFTAKQP